MGNVPDYASWGTVSSSFGMCDVDLESNLDSKSNSTLRNVDHEEDQVHMLKGAGINLT